ncbi:MAG: C40 family peptidase [Oscillospiraceae bacterium]
MALASVKAETLPLFEKPSAESARLDEALYGMSVQVIQTSESGWSYVRTEHHTEGYAAANRLELDAEVAAAWRKYQKMVVLAPYIDVQRQNAPEAPRVLSVPRGGILVPLGQPGIDGWQKVGLTDGAVGYTRASYLGEVIEDWNAVAEDDMRWNLVETALSYNGTAWRSGGRSPLGIDAAGLAAMTYQMNGVVVPREVFWKPGTALRKIEARKMDEGDVIYFVGSVGIYMGEQKFVHATDLAGGEGVVVSSLDAKDEDYRGDLAGHIVAVASLYG